MSKPGVKIVKKKGAGVFTDPIAREGSTPALGDGNGFHPIINILERDPTLVKSCFKVEKTLPFF